MSISRPNRLRLTCALVATTVLSALLLGCAPQPQQKGIIISDPYATVDWESTGRYKANLHTHTTVSDGRLNPHEVVDRYHAQGHTILAITDHNRVTYPWTGFSQLEPSGLSRNTFATGDLESPDLVYQGRNPAELGMLAVQGNELSAHHHMGSFFTNHNGTSTEVASLRAIGEKGGMAMFYHPGRYDRTIQFYVDLYRRFPHLFGLEVYNQGNRYPGDRLIWDQILSQLLPEQVVWGYSNDDMHYGSHLGRNWNMMLMPELSEDALRTAFKNGTSYFVYSPHANRRPLPPVIQSIAVDHERGTIRISAKNYQSIDWISDGRLIHSGPTLKLAKYNRQLGRYVRAKLRGEGDTIAGTQPFALRRPVKAGISILDADGRASYADDTHILATVTVTNTWDAQVSATASAGIGGRELARKAFDIPVGGSATMDVPVPLAAINSNQMLEVRIDMGAEFGGFRELYLPLPLELALPIAIETVVPAADKAVIIVRNLNISRAITVNLVAAADAVAGTDHHISRQVTIEPEAEARVDYALPVSVVGRELEVRIAASWDRSFGLPGAEFVSKIDLRGVKSMPHMILPRDFRMDGTLAVWKEPQATLRTDEDVFPPAARKAWNGPNDHSALIYWAQDENYLMVAARVHDDVHSNIRAGDNLWNGDAMQLAIAPPGGTPTNIVLALNVNGVELKQFSGPDSGLSEKAQYNVTRDKQAATTTYEIRLPLESMGVEPRKGTIFGLNVVFFDDDTGEGQRRWLQVAPGLAGGRDVSKFPQFVITEN